MGNVGFQEMLVIAVVALLVFGPERLPELARQAGKALARFRQETSKGVAELKRAAQLEDLDRELKAMRAELRELGGTPGAPRRVAAARVAPPPTDPDAT